MYYLRSYVFLYWIIDKRKHFSSKLIFVSNNITSCENKILHILFLTFKLYRKFYNTSMSSPRRSENFR